MRVLLVADAALGPAQMDRYGSVLGSWGQLAGLR
jgi:hypothetical protein